MSDSKFLQTTKTLQCVKGNLWLENMADILPSKMPRLRVFMRGHRNIWKFGNDMMIKFVYSVFSCKNGKNLRKHCAISFSIV